MQITYTPAQIVEMREKTGLIQADFWGAIGITQSSGSRYETGERALPQPAAQLLRLVYAEGVDLATANRKDLEIVRLLKAKHPSLYKKLKSTV